MQADFLRVGIDACNIRHGGGLTHLIQLLHAADPTSVGIGEVVIWSRAEVLARVPERPWLRKEHHSALNGSLVQRMAWQRLSLPKALHRAKCDVLFAPGGLLPALSQIRTVTMSRNMLPFERVETARLGRFSKRWLKMQVLRMAQLRSMRRADGLILLNNYARQQLSGLLGGCATRARVIPHGLAERFFCDPRPAVPTESFGANRPFRVLYVSTVDVHKHQWQVVRAAGLLREQGLPIHLDLVGSSMPEPLARLKRTLAEVDPAGAFTTYHDGVPFEELHRSYREADAFVFASSCENLPNILLEAMAAGLPIACSNMGPMPEVLGDAGMFFDPLDVVSPARAIRTMYEQPELRDRLAHDAFIRAKAYSWTRCAEDTFAFIAEIANERHRTPARGAPDDGVQGG